MSETRLGHDVYMALAAIGWADGQLDPDEADAILRTAADEGLSLEEMADIERAAREPVDLGAIDRSRLSKEDRLFVYAVASWMTRLDGVVNAAETEKLARLGEALGIPERPRAHADAVAQEVALQPEGDRPARYDLLAVRRILGERLARRAPGRGGQ